MRSLLLLALLAACSTGTKPQRDDAITPPSRPEPATAMPKVFMASPTGEVAVSVEVVKTAAKIERGLMYREHLPPDDGMLFLMGSERDHTFYMRNTLIPLDMLFITKDMTIAGIVERAEPRTETLRSVGARSLYVLEVNGGWAKAHQITPGAKVRFDGITP